jgi:ribosomal protein L40E
MEIPGDTIWFLALLVFGAVAFVFVLATAQQYRRHSMLTETRVCRACGQGHPGIARFCRQCGQKL